MNTTKPSLPPATPPPISQPPSSELQDLRSEVLEWRAMYAELEKANEELLTTLSLARQELAATSPLLMDFGEEGWAVTVNARSIRKLQLQEKSDVNEYGQQRSLNLWAVLLDDSRVTDYLPLDQAMVARARIKQAWADAITPPSR